VPEQLVAPAEVRGEFSLELEQAGQSKERCRKMRQREKGREEEGNTGDQQGEMPTTTNSKREEGKRARSLTDVVVARCAIALNLLGRVLHAVATLGGFRGKFQFATLIAQGEKTMAHRDAKCQCLTRTLYKNTSRISN